MSKQSITYVESLADLAGVPRKEAKRNAAQEQGALEDEAPKPRRAIAHLYDKVSLAGAARVGNSSISSNQTGELVVGPDGMIDGVRVPLRSDHHQDIDYHFIPREACLAITVKK